MVQVIVPLTVLPALGLVGNPSTAATMSACGTTAIGSVSALLLVFGSAVALPAVVVILREPLAGAMKVLVHVMLLPTASAAGSGLGVHDCAAPAGNPLKAHVGLTAALKPVLEHVPDTVTLCPALTLSGTVVEATISA